MNPLRSIGIELPIVLIVVSVCLLIVGFGAWARRRERRGEWGPGFTAADLRAGEGYSPLDLRGSARRTPVSDPEDEWMLGLAAPFVEGARLLHDRWSLVPSPCDSRWKRRLVEVAGELDTVRAWEWRARCAESRAQLESALEKQYPLPTLVWHLAGFAMLVRLGVAARHIAAPAARTLLSQAAMPVRHECSTWLQYGDAYIAAAETLTPGRTADVRASVRRLYAPGGPWVGIGWPAPPAGADGPGTPGALNPSDAA